MSCEAFKFCPGCGKRVEHAPSHPTEVPVDVRRLRLAGAGPYVDACIEALAVLRAHGPLTTVQVRKIGFVHQAARAMHYCMRAGFVEKLPIAAGDHFPKYRAVEG